MADFYWPWIGVVTGGAVVTAFIVGVAQRRWTGTALYVALGCLVIALLHMVAPFRGSLDPAYPGYSFGLISLAGGPLVGVVAGLFYLLAASATVIAVRNRAGPSMWLVTALSAVVLINLGGYLAAGLTGAVPPLRVELGQYLQLATIPATVLAAAVILLPFAIGLPWSLRRARAANPANKARL